MIERHQDYVLRNVTVGANQTAQFVVPLDSDAPFALRTVISSGMPGQGFQFTITGLDDRKYTSGAPLAAVDSLLNPATFFIVYPQITFPAQISIQVSVTDLSGAGITNGVLVFRGTKLYPEGTVFGPQYPKSFAELAFRYGYNFTVPNGTAMNPAVLAAQPLDIQSDADFVVRMASCYSQIATPPLSTPGSTFTPGQSDVILRDQYGKAYSNDWVPTEVLFPVYYANNSALAWSIPDVTIFPEIYLIRNSQLLLDIRSTGGAAPNALTFVLHGAKVFPL